MLRGEIRLTDLDPARSGEANKRRPAVIVSNDRANASAARLGRGVVTIVPVTSNVEQVYPFQVLLAAEIELRIGGQLRGQYGADEPEPRHSEHRVAHRRRAPGQAHDRARFGDGVPVDFQLRRAGIDLGHQPRDQVAGDGNGNDCGGSGHRAPPFGSPRRVAGRASSGDVVVSAISTRRN